MDKVKPKEYLRVWQVALKLGLSRERVHQLVKEGRLELGDMFTGHILHITRESFEAEKALRDARTKEVMEEQEEDTDESTRI